MFIPGFAADDQHRAVLLETRNSKLVVLGGADRDRTGDPLVANQVLSQLSYSPIPVFAS